MYITLANNHVKYFYFIKFFYTYLLFLYTELHLLHIAKLFYFVIESRSDSYNEW
jgi:hypothetical protein